MDLHGLDYILNGLDSISKELIVKSFIVCGMTKDSIGEFDENIHVFKVIISKYTLLNNKFKADGAIPKGIDLLRQRRCETEISELNLREEIDAEQDETCDSDYSIEI